jgi:hypothetical protein
MYRDLLDPSGGERDRSINMNTPLLMADIGLGFLGEPVGNILTNYAHGLTPIKGGYSPRSISLLETKPNPAIKLGYGKNRVSGLGKSLYKLGMLTSILSIASIGVSAISNIYKPGLSERGERKTREEARNEVYPDTAVAYTQRRRALQAIHDSNLSVGRALIGRESSYLHK